MTTASPVLPATSLVAVVGNPNTGKSTLFNALTGLRQHVGNYPGVTVETKEGLSPARGRRRRPHRPARHLQPRRRQRRRDGRGRCPPRPPRRHPDPSAVHLRRRRLQPRPQPLPRHPGRRDRPAGGRRAEHDGRGRAARRPGRRRRPSRRSSAFRSSRPSPAEPGHGRAPPRGRRRARQPEHVPAVAWPPAVAEARKIVADAARAAGRTPSEAEVSRLLFDVEPLDAFPGLVAARDAAFTAMTAASIDSVSAEAFLRYRHLDGLLAGVAKKTETPDAAKPTRSTAS